MREDWESEISVYELAVDTESPEKFDLGIGSFIDENGVKQFYLSFATIDMHSGLDYYHVVDDEEQDFSHNPYVLGSLPPGVYGFEVTAYDKAGNAYVQTTGFTLVKDWQFPWIFVILLTIFILWLITTYWYSRKYLIEKTV